MSGWGSLLLDRGYDSRGEVVLGHIRVWKIGLQSQTHLSRTPISVTCLTISTARRITSSKHCDDPCWQLATLSNESSASFLILEEHIDLIDSILNYGAIPFHVKKEELALKTARDLESDTAIACRNIMVDGKLSLYEGLDSRLFELSANI